MSEGGDDSTDDSQKTEEPSARKLEEAHKRGQTIYSREITNWVGIFTSTLLILMAGPGIMSDMTDAMKSFIANAAQMPTDPIGLQRLVLGLFMDVGSTLILPAIILMFMGIMSGFVQTGPLLTTEPIKPSLSKISIIAGIGRLFSKRSLVEFAKGIFKLLVVSLAAYMALEPYFDGIEHFVGADIRQSMFDLEALFLKMMIAILIVLFFLAIMDYAFQRHDFMQKMRMSKQELKDEYKQTEGDPHVKARLRSLREQKARQRMMQAVPTADVVITNPTHYAVALKYDAKDMAAPQMVAKGADEIAQKIKEVAKEHKIPVIENAPLARALFDSMEIEQSIPTEHWKAVAEVITYVFKLKGKKI